MMKRIIWTAVAILISFRRTHAQSSPNESVFTNLPDKVYQGGKVLIEWGVINHEKTYTVSLGGCTQNDGTYQRLYSNGTNNYFDWIVDVESDLVGGSCRLMLDCDFTGYQFQTPEIAIVPDPTSAISASAASVAASSIPSSTPQSSLQSLQSLAATVTLLTSPSSSEHVLGLRDSKETISAAQIAGIILGAIGVTASIVLGLIIFIRPRTRYASMPKEQGSIAPPQAVIPEPTVMRELDSRQIDCIVHELPSSHGILRTPHDQSRPISYEMPSGAESSSTRKSGIDANSSTYVDLLEMNQPLAEDTPNGTNRRQPRTGIYWIDSRRYQ